MKKKNPHAGGDFDDFLKDEGIYEQVSAYARRRNPGDFILDRMPAILDEFFVVLGDKPLSKTFEQPPAWALGAIQVLCDKGGPFHPIKKLKKPGSKWTREERGLAAGMMKSGATFLDQGSPGLMVDEKKDPRLKKYRGKAARLAADSMLERIKAITPKKNDLLPKVKGTGQLIEYQKGEYSGSTTFFNEEGEMKEDSLTVQICLFLWFFWPLLPVKGEGFKIKKLHVWLAEGPGIYASEKQVEKICRKIGLHGGKRGRPKNKPISA